MPGGEFSSPRSHNEPAPAKKLTDGELKASADRLSHTTRKEVELPPLVEKRALTDDQLKQSLERIYTHSLEQKKKMLEALDKKAHPDMTKHVTLDSDTLQTAFQRMHNGAMDQKKDTMKKLRAKYIYSNGPGRKLSPEERQASATRLCNTSMEEAKEAHTKLFQKYVVGTATVFPKLSADQIRASGDRLSAKKA